MAASVNKVFLMGNLTRDPEMRYIPSGQPVASFSIAVNRVYNDQSGNKKEEVTFLRVVAWRKLAEICNEYLKKGSSVFVEGRLQSRSWQAQDGSKRNTVEVVADNVQFMSRSGARVPQNDSNQDAGAPQEQQSVRSNNITPMSPMVDADVMPGDNGLVSDEEVPF